MEQDKILRDKKGRFVKGGNAYLFAGFKKGQHPSPETEFKKGHKLSEESEKKRKKNISEALQGRKLSEEHRKELSKVRQKGLKERTIKVWNKGLTIEDERVRKNCEANKKWREENIIGKTYEEIYGKEKAEKIKKIQRINNSLAKQGEKNPMFGKIGELSPRWIDGRSFEPHDPEFNNKFKRAIRRRDNQICMLCKTHREKLSRTLDVHHINYDKKLSIPQNCISLCRHCHNSLVHKDKNKLKHWTKFFQSLLAEKYNYQYSEIGEVILNLNKIKI